MGGGGSKRSRTHPIKLPYDGNGTDQSDKDDRVFSLAKRRTITDVKGASTRVRRGSLTMLAEKISQGLGTKSRVFSNADQKRTQVGGVRKTIRSISLAAEQRFIELENNRNRKRALQAVFEEGKDTTPGHDPTASTVQFHVEQSEVLGVQFNLVRAMIPDIVYEQFAQRNVNQPMHFKSKAYLALFDIKGFSTYAADIDLEQRSSGETVEKIHSRLCKELLGLKGSIDDSYGLEKQITASPVNGAEEDKELSDIKGNSGRGDNSSTLMHAPFHKTCDHAGEKLQQILNRTLHEILICANDYRIDVIKFAGDALLCALWDKEGDPEESHMITNLLNFAHHVEVILKKRKRTLKLHVGISHGNVLCVNTGATVNIPNAEGQHGSDYSRYEFFVTGMPIVEAGKALDHASGAGDVCISSKTYEAVWIDADLRKHHFKELHFQMIKGQDGERFYKMDKFELIDPSFPALSKDMGARDQDSIITPESVSLLSTYVPGYARYFVSSATQRDEQGHAAIKAFGSKRVVSILFVHIPWLDSFDMDDPDADPDSYLEECNDIMSSIVELVGAFEICLRQFLVDDKGAVAILVVGCPPLTHDDNATRACFAACSLQMAHQERLRIGIASGKTFLGLIGTSERYEFAVVGDIVNMSARLMSHAAEGSVVCDQATRTFAASSSLNFSALPAPVLLKGQQGKVKVYTVGYHSPDLGSTGNEDQAYDKLFADNRMFVERRMHQQALKSYLWASTSSQQTRQNSLQIPSLNLDDNKGRFQEAVCVITGESGTGKTSLVGWAMTAMRGVYQSYDLIPFIAQIEVSPRLAPMPAWSELIGKVLRYGLPPHVHGQNVIDKVSRDELEKTLGQNGDSSLENKDSNSYRLEAFLQQRAGSDTAVNSDNIHDVRRSSGQKVIRRTAQTVVTKKLALSRINLHLKPHGVDYGLESGRGASTFDRHGRAKRQGKGSDTSENGSDKDNDPQSGKFGMNNTNRFKDQKNALDSSSSSYHHHHHQQQGQSMSSASSSSSSHGLLKNQNSKMIKVMGNRNVTFLKMPPVLEIALSLASDFGLEPLDFQVLRHFGIIPLQLNGETVDSGNLSEWRKTFQNSPNSMKSIDDLEHKIASVLACLFYSVYKMQCRAMEKCSVGKSIVNRPIFIVFDGAEHFDDDAWAIFEILADVLEERSCQHAVKVIATCTVSDAMSEVNYESAFYKNNVRLLQLSDLSLNGMDTLLAHLFDARQIDKSVSRFLWEHTRGNPKRLMRFVEYLVTNRMVKVNEPSSTLTHFSPLYMQKQHFSNLASTDVLRRFDRLPRPAQLILQIITVVTIQSVEISCEDLLKLFKMCCLLYLPQFAKLHIGKPSFTSNYTNYVSMLVVEHFITVHKGAILNAPSSPDATSGTGKGDGDINARRKSSISIHSSLRSSSLLESRKISMIGGPINQDGGFFEGGHHHFLDDDEYSKMDEAEDKYFYSADPILYSNANDSILAKRIQERIVEEFYAPYSQRVREAIYQSIPEGRRNSLHKDICAFYETMYHRDQFKLVQSHEEIYAMLAGHCRLAKQPFRCFRYYEMASNTCIGNQDWLNAIYMLKLACLACVEFEGLVGGESSRVLDDEFTVEVVLRFAKWHIQIGKLMVQGNFPVSVAISSVRRGIVVLEEMKRQLYVSSRISNEILWAGTTYYNDDEHGQMVEEQNQTTSALPKLEEKDDEIRGATSSVESTIGAKSNGSYSNMNLTKAMRAKPVIAAALVRIKDSLRDAKRLEKKLVARAKQLRKQLLSIQSTIDFGMDHELELERKEVEVYFSTSMQEDSMENASYGFTTLNLKTMDTTTGLTDSQRQNLEIPIVPTEELLAGILLGTRHDKTTHMPSKQHDSEGKNNRASALSCATAKKLTMRDIQLKKLSHLHEIIFP